MKNVYLLLALFAVASCDAPQADAVSGEYYEMEKIAGGFGAAYRFIDRKYNNLCYVYDRSIHCQPMGDRRE